VVLKTLRTGPSIVSRLGTGGSTFPETLAEGGSLAPALTALCQQSRGPAAGVLPFRGTFTS